MKETRLLMGMPITVDVVGGTADDIAAVFDYFAYIDETFSTYKPQSEMMRINRGDLDERDWSDDMRIIFMLAEETKQRTGGYFDIRRPASDTTGRGPIDPSGIVKGWAIWQVAQLLARRGLKNYYVEAGGDIQTAGVQDEGIRDEKPTPWTVGIKNPLKQDEIVKVLYAPTDANGFGVATSGTYIRGAHIYNPKTGARVGAAAGGAAADDIVSLTVIGPNVYEADRFATAAFAMGHGAAAFIESLPSLEGYMINKDGIATMTSGFNTFLISSHT